MANKNKNGHWIDPRGQAVPAKYISVQDKKRDKTVEIIVNRALKLQTQMTRVKSEMRTRVTEYITEMFKKHNVEYSKKGNVTLTNFSGTKQVEFAMNDVITFDETLQVAKAKIDECIVKWGSGANEKLLAVVNQAFQVDKKGRINTAAILKLRTLEIRDNDWAAAMDILTRSVKIEGTRQYMILRVRENPDQKFQTIHLNFSSL